MTSSLRIDRAALTMTWGRVEYTITNLHKTRDGFAFTAKPPEFSASTIAVNPVDGVIHADGIPQRIRNWQVNGTVATCETYDPRPDDPELVALFARRQAMMRAG